MNGRIIGLSALVIALVVVGTLIFRTGQAPPQSPVSVQSVVAPVPQRVTALRATMQSCERIGRKTRVVGVINNTGTTALSAVTVQSVWKNSDGLVLGTGLVYAVGDDNPVLPGESREFEDTTELSNVARCNVEAVDWFSSEESG